MNNNFDDIVLNRHSVRSFDKNVKISRAEMTQILQEAMTAPSSINMQPWRLVVVDSEEGKEKLRPLVKFNSRQNDTSAAMILVFGDLQCYKKADLIYSKAVEEGLMSLENKELFMQRYMPFYESLPRDKMNDIVKIDASLMSMQLMLVARKYGYDTNPIGGFEHEGLAETFGLDKERHVPVMIIAIGKADYETHKTIRLAVDDVTKFI
ncbi:nitroreductase family protein [Ureaplasma ceti]|uniref:Nitroreductase family protein n=1 Tax=Ureaplasma ceti TaxID=3119530 RepID=A0ABP9UCA8_9BACT